MADDIVAGAVSAREKIAYFVFAQVLYVVVGYAAYYVSSVAASWLFVYEVIVVSVITVAGAQRVASSYQRPLDGDFFEIAYLLSVPLAVKTTLAAWAAIYGGSWVFSTVLERISPESAESARALSYWAHRFWQLLPFLVAVAIAVVYWYRLAHHVTYVVTKRGT